jgi:hypothetical protein
MWTNMDIYHDIFMNLKWDVFLHDGINKKVLIGHAEWPACVTFTMSYRLSDQHHHYHYAVDNLIFISYILPYIAKPATIFIHIQFHDKFKC